MIKEKYKQLCLYAQIGGISTIEFTQMLPVMRKKKPEFKKKLNNIMTPAHQQYCCEITKPAKAIIESKPPRRTIAIRLPV